MNWNLILGKVLCQRCGYKSRNLKRNLTKTLRVHDQHCPTLVSISRDQKHATWKLGDFQTSTENARCPLRWERTTRQGLGSTCWAGLVYEPQRHMHWRFEWMSHFLMKLAIYTYPQISAVFSPLQLYMMSHLRSAWKVLDSASLNCNVQSRPGSTAHSHGSCPSSLQIMSRGEPEERWETTEVVVEPCEIFVSERICRYFKILVAFLFHILS